MQTLKIKYSLINEEDASLIHEYQRQYSNCLHILTNAKFDNPDISEIELRAYQSQLNHIDLIDSWFFQSAVKQSIQIYKSAKALCEKDETPDRPVFGGRKNFILRSQKKITADEFKQKALSAVHSIGEAQFYGNRKFRLQSDVTSLTFQPNRNIKIDVALHCNNKQKNHLSKIYDAQINKAYPVTYQIDDKYVYITVDECLLESKHHEDLKPDRVIAIDMNPNAIGYSIVDWYSSEEYNVIESGVISLYEMTKEYTKHNRNKLPSNAPKRIALNNKRRYETVMTADMLVKKAVFYKCSMFVLEELKMKSSNKKKGKKYNALCNNMWLKSLLKYEIEKRCKVNYIWCKEINPAYSSWIGNTVFRKENKPDPVLASIEIGRRGYEFYHQYVVKDKKQEKNIIFPSMELYGAEYAASLEECSVCKTAAQNKALTIKEGYDEAKRRNLKWRLSLDSFNLKFSSLFHYSSMVLQVAT